MTGKRIFNLRAVIMLKLGFILLFCSPLLLSARHIVGGEITYECLGLGAAPNTNRYQFRMDVYRDCIADNTVLDSAPGAPFTATATLYAGINRLIQTFELTDLEVEEVSEFSLSPCVQLPPDVCVERGTYTFPIVDLPVIDESYHMVYQRCCRNATTTNILQPSVSGATYYIEITPAAQRTTPCNSSPIFTKLAPIAICANEPLAFDYSAWDKNGHRLAYSFCRPKKGGGVGGLDFSDFNGLAPDPDAPPPFPNINFLASYSYLKPLGEAANLTLDSLTGYMSALPDLQGQYVLAVCVREYDENDQLLSEVRRDFQFNVVSCSPLIEVRLESDAVNVLNDEFIIESCGELEVNISNESIDRQFISDLFWEFYLPDDTIRLDTWDAALRFPEAGTYRGLIGANPGLSCSDSANILVKISPLLEANFTYEYDTCTISEIAFQDMSIVGTEVSRRQWGFGDGASSRVTNPNHQYEEPGSYEVQLLVRDENDCLSTYSQTVDYYPRPQRIDIATDKATHCTDEEISFHNLSEPISGDYQVVWDFGDDKSAISLDAKHTYEMAGTYDVSLNITSPTGCEASRTFMDFVTVYPSPRAAFTYTPDMPSDRNNTLSFFNTSIGADTYSWYFGEEGESNLQNPIHSFRDTGMYQVRLLTINDTGCTDSTFQWIDIVPDESYFLPNAFTPNFDGKNDFFLGKGALDNLSDFSMSVRNRYGELMFYTESPHEGWDGKKQTSSTLAPDGSYVYAIRYRTARGQVRSKSGMLVLMR